MGGDDFGIMYSPDNCDFSNWPVQAFSNFDCFHPSVLGHQFTAKVNESKYAFPAQILEHLCINLVNMEFNVQAFE